MAEDAELVVSTDSRVAPKERGLPWEDDPGLTTKYVIGRAVFGEPVVPLGPFDVRGELLRGWDFDGRAWRLELRPGLEFSNGVPVRATHLEFALLRWFHDPEWNYRKGFLCGIEGVDAIRPESHFVPGEAAGVRTVDDRTLRVETREPDPAFLRLLTSPSVSPVIPEQLRSGVTWRPGQVPIGAGMYRIREVKSRNDVIVELREDVEAPPTAPRSVRFVRGPNPSVQPDIYLYKEQRRPSGFREVPLRDSDFILMIFFNYHSEAGRSSTFRRAVAAAIDRDELARPHPSYAPAFHIVPGEFWSKSLPPRHDAQELFASLEPALRSRKLAVPIIPSIPERVRVDLGRQLERAGFDIDWIRFEGSMFQWKGEEHREQPMLVSGFGANFDPLSQFSVFLQSPDTCTEGIDTSELGSGPAFKPPADDLRAYTRLWRAAHGVPLEQRLAYIERLSQLFARQALAVPLLEERSTVSFDPARVGDLGDQSSVTRFRVERVVMQ